MSRPFPFRRKPLCFPLSSCSVSFLAWRERTIPFSFVFKSQPVVTAAEHGEKRVPLEPCQLHSCPAHLSREESPPPTPSNDQTPTVGCIPRFILGPEDIWPADLLTLPQREPLQSAPFMQETENNPFGLLQLGYSDGESKKMIHQIISHICTTLKEQKKYTG